MRDEGEFETATCASVTMLVDDDFSETAFGAKDIFPEDDPPNVFLDLCFGWYLFEMVHILHMIANFVPSGLVYPVNAP
jgi:hypothetical protein